MNWKHNPPVLVGEKVLWSGKSFAKPENGIVRWIGNIPEISLDWLVGIELDKAQPGLAGDGFWKGRKLFECPSNHGLLVPAGEVEKFCSKKKYSKSVSPKDASQLKLDDTQIEDLTRSNLLYEEHKKFQTKIRCSYSESKSNDEFCDNRSISSSINFKKKNFETTDDLKDKIHHEFGKKILDIKNLPQKIKFMRRNFQQSGKSLEPNFFKSDTDSTINDSLENLQNFHSKIYSNELIKNMNEVAGYFKEIKEGDERFEKQKQTDNVELCDTNEPSHSKPKKLFSFLKWFNKKQKNEPNSKLFKESSAASSPMFPRKETSSCESIDTLFSTQTVRSFAYIPPTQYVPSAPPLDYDKSSYENFFDISLDKNRSEEIKSIYDRKKKRRAPEPPRLCRENSLPTTLEYKKPNEEFDGIKTYHRRTVSESFKDKKAGAYHHVQGKRKAPPPPAASLYPNLQKLNNQHPSLYKKKKPAPSPPESNTDNLNQFSTDIQKQKKFNLQTDKTKEEISNDLKGNENSGKEMKVNYMSKNKLTKDAYLSPLPSRPWYKRSHRDSTGNNFIRKDLLKGFDKKKNKELDDWMPEVGFPRRSLLTESSYNKFNIFSKLEKNEEKKKEEKRKSQISILTNISELDREAAEIVKKEQAEEKKIIAANDEKYYLLKQVNDKINRFTDEKSAVVKDNFKSDTKNHDEKKKTANKKLEDKLSNQKAEKISQSQTVVNHVNTTDIKKDENQNTKEEHATTKEEQKLKDKKNNLQSDFQSNGNQKENLFLPKSLIDSTNSSSQSLELREISQPNENLSKSRSNYFNVQNKEVNYLNEPWVCRKCTLENPGWKVFCEICSSVKSRFLFNTPVQKIQSQLQKEIVKPESVSETEEPKELNFKADKEQHTTVLKTAPAYKKNEKKTSSETTDEVKEKRMNFFTSKSGSSSESDNNELEQLLDDSYKMQIRKDCAESKTLFEKSSKKEIPIEKNKETKENISDSSSNEELKEKKKEKQEKFDKLNISKKNSKKKLVLSQNYSNNSKQETVQTNLPLSDESHQTAEAYIITKTTLLEDIIIKKPERSKKVSSSLQTRSSILSSPEIEEVRPPPRTKKITFESTAQAEKETEADTYPKNSTQKIKNFSQKDLEELTHKLTQAEGLADFRANIETMPLNTEMNTVAVNRLLRKLETAINSGDHFVAAGLAKELALMKINCTVTRQAAPSQSTSKINIDLYIEDKVSHRGPIPLEVFPTMTLLQLKTKVQQELGIPIEVQRWILGKKLATDDNKSLEVEGIKTNYSSLFLYLVASDNEKTNQETLTKSEFKSHQDPQPILNNASDSDTKEWYYNYKGNDCNYGEDSEDESKNSKIDLINKKTVCVKETIKTNGSNRKQTETNLKISEVDISSKFDGKSEGTENELKEKELKFIPVNSVKEKVKKLNKTFSENAITAAKPYLRFSQSSETWKCHACNVVNLQGKVNCLSCNAKKKLAEPNNKKIVDQKSLKEANTNSTASDNLHYKTLIELQDADLVPNSEPFNCSICLVDYAAGEGVTLKDCLHTFCRTCLVGTVQFSEDAEVKCPYSDKTYSCPSVLQQREIKALVPQKIFELHLAKSVKEAENKIENAFHCKTPDCKGWCIYEDNVNEFRCPVCRSTNCLTCQAVHNGMNCREYQERVKDASETDVDAKKTRAMLNEMVEKGEALPCPKCQVVLMKKWGCDWLRCSMCKTEICWVTRGFRWGPEGKGDTSGGCKCGVNGVKCHPKCNYCH